MVACLGLEPSTPIGLLLARLLTITKKLVKKRKADRDRALVADGYTVVKGASGGSTVFRGATGCPSSP